MTDGLNVCIAANTSFAVTFLERTYNNERVGRLIITESVDSLCRDGADMPMPPTKNLQPP